MDPVNAFAIPFISGIFNVLLDRLASDEVRDFLMGKSSTKTQITKLKTMMLVISKVLNDAEEKQMMEPLVKAWLDNLRDVMYDVEDLLDEIHVESLQKNVESSTQTRPSISRVLRISAALLDPFHQGLESRIKEINQRLEEFPMQIDILGLKAGQTRRVSSRRLPTTSLIDETVVYGRDSEREQIISFLEYGISRDYEENELVKAGKKVAAGKGKIQVVAIVGLPGIGKTTLAQLIYNDPRMDGVFYLKSWVYVSEVFYVFRITKAILKTVQDEDLDSLQTTLCKRITRRKLFIVLDDVWSENFNSWDALLLPLKAAVGGSTLIVTTRNSSVAAMIRPDLTLKLCELADEHSTRLLKSIAFGDHSPSDVRLEAIGEEVAQKCRGLPLSVTTLGGLLRSTSLVEEWEAILKSRLWELPTDRNDILPALLLSYEYLPSHLKRCFAYCSIFPKNFKFEASKLVLLWMAEGFIPEPRNGRRIEEVGNEYFQELVSRLFFQPFSSKDPYFIIHDSLHELAIYINQEFASMLEPGDPRVIPRRTRHLAYAQTKYDDSRRFAALGSCGVGRLRTFLAIESPGTSACFLRATVLKSLQPVLSKLRVLSLSGYKIAEMPLPFDGMKHLHYLDFSCTAISRLSESICTLYGLQTLLLRSCHSLKLLPVGLGKLISLRHLDIRGTKLHEMPKQIRSLSSLQTLTAFVVGRNRGACISELREFQFLQGELCIYQLRHVVSEKDAFQALWNKEYLEKLVLEWENTYCDDSTKDRLVLDALKPHTNLRKFTIKNYCGTTFPNWLGQDAYINLMKLHLRFDSSCRPYLSYLLRVVLYEVNVQLSARFARVIWSQRFECLWFYIHSELLRSETSGQP